MNSSWKSIWPALLWTLSGALAGKAQEIGNPTLSILVFDYAGLSDGSMRKAESLTDLLLSRGGIATRWFYCRGHQTGGRPDICDAISETGTVIIRVLPLHTGKANPLGDALGSANVTHRFASVYAAEIRKYADQNGLSEGTLTAYAMAHEIGHLLLGESHAPSGLMRAAWGKNEFRQMAQRWLDFSPSDRQSISQTKLNRNSRPAGEK